MPLLILRKYRGSEDVELPIEDLEDLSVKELRENAASRLAIPLEELKLVFGGRILKTGKAVVDYRITAGCTIYVLAVKPKGATPKQDHSDIASRGGSGLMSNPRVLALIGRVLGNPAVLQDMAHGIGMATGSAAMMQLLGNQQLLDNLTDPDNIQEYIRENPNIASMMEQVIRQFLGHSGSEGQDQEQLVDLLESHLEEEMVQAEREGEAQRTLAQEQMFEHSQALQAHNQHQQQLDHTPSSSQQETSFNPATSQLHGSVSRASRQNSGGGGGITQDQLASALASAMGSSPVASINHSQLNYSSSSEQPASLPFAPPPSLSSSLQARPDSSREAGHGAISAASLQQALASVLPASTAGTSQAANSHQSNGRYEMQLEQLRLMGITDETACLHALAATNGDLQAALDILYSQ